MKSVKEHMGALGLRRGEEQAYQCQRHGQYRGRALALAGRGWMDPPCPPCEDERKAQASAEAAREVAEIARARRLSLAGVPRRFQSARLEGYDAQALGQQRALRVARRYVERFAERLEAGSGLMFLGRTGTGKTLLLCAMVGALLRAGYAARYCDTLGLLQRVKASYAREAQESEAQVIEHFVRPDLLVIDDIGVQHGTDAERAVLHHILDRRYLAVRPTAVAGNVDLEGLKAYLGERAVSRLHEAGGLVVTFDWDDYWMRRR